MLRKLHVRRFKSLANVSIVLPRFSVLFGVNAAGKSNILDAVHTLAMIGTQRTLMDALGGPRSRIFKAAQSEFAHLVVAACPDPHVERWFLADPDSFFEVVGLRPMVGEPKCERDYYKQVLRTAITDAGHPPTLDGLEFASELAARMDFFRAGKADGSIKAFVDDLRVRLRRLMDQPVSGDGGG